MVDAGVIPLECRPNTEVERLGHVMSMSMQRSALDPRESTFKHAQYVIRPLGYCCKVLRNTCDNDVPSWQLHASKWITFLDSYQQ